MTENRRLELARKLAERAFFNTEETKAGTITRNDVPDIIVDQKQRRMQNTLKIISDPKNNVLYSMDCERQLLSDSKIKNAFEIMPSKSNLFVNVKSIARKLREILKESLFACEVYVGICPTTSLTVLEFTDDTDYVRRVIRGKSTCFECIDQKDIVLEASPIQDSNAMGQGVHEISSGESTVYVPLLGKGGGIGVIEIHGLVTEGITELTNYQRSTTILNSMIIAKDYKFVNSLRLWRLPGKRSGGEKRHNDNKDYNRANYQIVAGKVTEAVVKKNGVIYFGGPRYTLVWEDGLTETAVTASELLEVYKNTPQSLGVSSKLDMKLTDDLLQLGHIIGEMMENQRRIDIFKELQQILRRPNLKDDVIINKCLEAIISIVHGITQVVFIGIGTDNIPIHILQKSPPLKSKGKFTKSLTRILDILATSIKDTANPLVTVEDGSMEWICTKLNIHPTYEWAPNRKLKHFYLYLTRHKHSHVPSALSDSNSFQDISIFLATTLSESWTKLTRKKERIILTKEIESKIGDWLKLSDHEVCQKIIDEIEHKTLPHAHVYIALINTNIADKNLDILQYVAANNNSNMIGQILRRGEGMSFEVMEYGETKIVNDGDMNKRKLLDPDSPIEVMYGKIKYNAIILKDRGHGCYDVLYSNGDKEAGVNVDRIIPIHTAFKMKRFGVAEMPFVCIPIKIKDKCIGIIGIDSMNRIPKSYYDPQPEPGLLTFLEQIGRILGNAIDIKRKNRAMEILSTAIQNFNIRGEDLADETYRAIESNLLYLSSFIATRIIYEKSETEKSKGIAIIMKKGEVEQEHLDWLHAYHPFRSNQKPIQRKSSNVIWLLFRNRPEVRGGEGKVFIYAISQKVPFQESDKEFIEALHKVLSIALQNLDTRKQRVMNRVSSLRDIQNLCADWMNRDVRSLFSEICELVHQCYYYADLYLGQLGKHGNEITYIAANLASKMNGKRLFRSLKSGVSFEAVDGLHHLFITNESSLARKLHHFGKRENFTYPFLVFPLVAYVDTVLGTLSIDNCDEYRNGNERQYDVVTFFFTIASYLSKAMKNYTLTEVKNELKIISLTANNFNEGIRKIKHLLLKLIPCALRVAEVCYEPHEVDLLQTNEILGKQVSLIPEDFVVFIKLLRAECFSKNVKNAVIYILWQGHLQISCKCDEMIEPACLKLFLPKGAEVNQISVQLILRGNYNNLDRDVARKSFGLQYIANCPLMVLEHTLDSPSLKEVHVAKVRMVCKILSQDALVVFSLFSIRCEGLNKTLGDTTEPDAFCIIKWIDSEVGRTNAIRKCCDPCWSALSIDLRILKEKRRDGGTTNNGGKFILEIWDSDLVGLGAFLGCVNLSLLENSDFTSLVNTWIDLVDHPNLPSDGLLRGKIQGRVMLQGSFVKAKDFDEDRIRSELTLLESDENDDSDDEDISNSYDEEDRKNLCEFGVLAARGLKSSEDSKLVDPFCIVYFNKEEIGRTAVVHNNLNPEWKDDVFILRIPTEGELETSILLVELWDMNMSGKGKFLGCVELTGKALVTHLCSGKYKRQWFDLENSFTLPENEQTSVQGELKLSGRPLSVKITGLEEDAKDRDLLEIELLAVSNLNFSRSSHIAFKSSIYGNVYWNSRLVHQTKHMDQADDFKWDKESITVRLPNSKGLSQCSLRIELITTSLIGHSTFCVATLSDESILKLLGQKGCTTAWYQLTDTLTSTDTRKRLNSLGDEVKVIKEIQLRGGPLGAPDIIVEDGRELWLDILAASSLSATKKNAKSDPFCIVYWNNKEIGRTAAIQNTLDPVWENQRFVLRTPMIEGVDNSLPNHCELRVEVWDALSHFSAVFLGCVILKKQSLMSFIGKEKAQMAWMPLGFLTSLSSQSQSHVRGDIKLRGGQAGAVDDSSIDLGEYKLKLVSASGLAVADIFDGSEPFVIVSWNGDELRRTKSVGKTLNPVWLHEEFLLRVRAGYELKDQSLSLEIIDLVHHDFLGCVLLSGDSLVEFFSHREGEDVTLPLTENPTYTKTETNLIQGDMTLRWFKVRIQAATENITRYRSALLWIKKASNLAKSDIFGSCDPYCIVKWRSALEYGGDEVEVGKTKVIKKTLNPEWEEKDRFIVKVPSGEDWSIISIRIEVWDLGLFGRGPFLGCVILEGESAKELLGRGPDNCRLPITYDLAINTEFRDKDQSLVQGSITLVGGLKESYEKKPKTGRGSVVSSVYEMLRAESQNFEVENIGPLEGFIDHRDNLGSEITFTLHKASNIDRRNISSYAVVYWNGNFLGKTKIVHDSHDPDWSTDSFTTRLPSDDNPVSCTLLIQIFKYVEGTVDELLGTVEATDKLLQELVVNRVDDMEFHVTPPLHSSLAAAARKSTLFISAYKVKKVRDELIPSNSRQQSRRFSNLYSMEVDGMNALKLEIQVFEVSKLVKSDLFGSINPYVVVLWCGEDVGKTAVVNNKLNVVYEHEIFQVDKPEGKQLKDCSLTFEVYNKKSFQGDEFLGFVHIPGDKLGPCCLMPDPSWSEFGKSDNVPPSKQKMPQARIQYGVKVLRSDPTAAKTIRPLPEGMKEVELTIHAASGLAKVDTFGKSDPYCVITWNDEVIGKTKTIKKSLDPIWEDETFIVTVPINFTGEGEFGGKVHSESIAGLLAGKRPANTLSIELWHGSQIIMNKAVFLGCLEFRGSDLAEIMSESEYLKRKWLPLTKTGHLNLKEQRHVQGRLEFMISPKYDPELDFGNMEVELFIVSARGLAKSDTFGKSDPYCIIRWNNRICGKTSVINNTLDPVWQNEKFRVSVPGYMVLEDCVLYIEVWDWDIVGRGDFLGSIKLTGGMLKDLVIENCLTDTWFELEMSEHLPSHLQELVQGQIEIRAGMAGVFGNEKNTIQAEFFIYAASNLGKATLFYLSDPFCILKINGREHGRTSVVHKSINPEWSDEKFLLTLPSNELRTSLVQVEVWNKSILGRDDFLGCVTMTGNALEEFMNRQEHDRRTWFDLKKVNGLNAARQKLVQGRLQIGCKRVYTTFDITGGEDTGLRADWSGDRDVAAGSPCLELLILKASNLSRLEGSTAHLPNTATPSPPYDPYCVILWDGVERGVTATCPSTSNPVWKNEHFTLKIPMNAEIVNTTLTFEVWTTALGKKVFLGQIVLSFWSILRLFEGEVTLQLEQRNPADYVTGSLTFNISVSFPFWDSARSLNSVKSIRRIEIFSATDLCMVNEKPPSVKCLLISEGVTKQKSVVIPNSNDPEWSSLYCDVILDMKRPHSVAIHVMHVDAQQKREVCIGVVEIPAEFILRPPLEAWDAWLSPHPKDPPFHYKFNVKGSVKVRISSDRRDPQSIVPWTSKFLTPLSALIVKDVCVTWNELSAEDEGDLLSLEQKQWLGTACELATVQELANRPEWIIMPFRDFGIKLQDTKLGTRPGNRYALCIERNPKKAAYSDMTILREVQLDIQSCITRLREKDVFAKMRACTIDTLRQTVRSFSKRNEAGVDSLLKRIANAVMLCVPGCSIFTAVISSDFMSMSYARFQSTSSDRYKEFVLYRSQGCDWECLERDARHFLIKSYKDLGIRKLCCHRPFRHSRFPRLVIPLKANDVSMGILGVENFDIYNHGYKSDFEYDSQLTKWLFQLGSIAGELLYHANELKAFARLESYILHWDCSAEGFLKLLLECCMSVLQSCRLLELWSWSSIPTISSTTGTTTSVNPIKSIAFQEPNIKNQIGRKVTINSIVITKCYEKEKEMEAVKETSPVSPTHTIKAIGKSRSSIVASSALGTSTNANINSSSGLLCGLRYNDIEQCQALHPTSTSNKEFILQSTDIFVMNDRDIILSVYSVDDRLNILSQHSGLVQLVTLRETKITCVLTSPKESSILQNNTTSVPATIPSVVDPSFTYHAELSLSWPSTEGGKTLTDKQKEDIQHFSLHIKRAYGLKKVDSFGSTDPYIIVKWGNKQIGKTQPKKGTLSPIWDENFILPYNKSETRICLLELWSMSLFGKDVLLGQVQISQDMLFLPPLAEVEMPLQPKTDITTKKVKAVTGFIVLHHDIALKDHFVEEMPASTSASINTPSAHNSFSGGILRRSTYHDAIKPALVIPAEIYRMENAALHLTVLHATDLAKVDFIGSSDPFAMVYIGNEGDCIGKTEVMYNNLNPVWNTEFTINLGMHKPETLSLSDFPVLRVEVWDMNRRGRGEFLGQVEIMPAFYLNRKGDEFLLQPSRTISKSKSKMKNLIQSDHEIKGSISLQFEVIDTALDIRRSKKFRFSSTESLMPLLYLEVCILGAKDLIVIDNGNGRKRQKRPNPYCVLIWNDEVVGKTLSKSNNQNPTWTGETFMICLSNVNFLVRDLILQLRHKSMGAEDDFLGEVCIPSDVLLHPKTGPLTQELRPSSSNLNAKVQGYLLFNLELRRIPQRINCSQTSVEVLDPLAPVTLGEDTTITVIRDEQLELERQKMEGINLPGIIHTIKQQTSQYQENSFERHGLISELHFGQFLSACNRRERTLLHGPIADIICVPTGLLATSTEPNPSIISIVARFGAGRVSKRDMQFVDELKQLASRGMHVISSRKQRDLNRATLLEELQSRNNHKSLDKILSYVVREIEESFECTATIYLMQTDGQSLVKYTRNDGVPNFDDNVSALTKLAAKFCRHKLLLQYFHGMYSVADLTWEIIPQISLTPLDELQQTIKEVEGPRMLREIKKLAPMEVGLGGMYMPIMGHMESFVGLLVLSGCDKASTSRYKIRKSIMDYATKNRTEQTNNDLDDGSSLQNESTEDDTKYVIRPEEGFSDSLVKIGKALGDAIFDSRIEHAKLNIEAYIATITANTSVTDILRYILTLLVSSAPHIREVAVWSVDLSFPVILLRQDVDGKKNEASKSHIFGGGGGDLSQILRSFNSMSSSSTRITSPPKLAHAQKLSEFSFASSSRFFRSQTKSMENNDNSHVHLRKGHNSTSRVGMILAGYFGSEDSSSLTALQKLGFASTLTSFGGDAVSEISEKRSRSKVQGSFEDYSKFGSFSLSLVTPHSSISPSNSLTNIFTKGPLLDNQWVVAEPALIRLQRELEAKINTADHKKSGAGTATPDGGGGGSFSRIASAFSIRKQSSDGTMKKDISKSFLKSAVKLDEIKKAGGNKIFAVGADDLLHAEIMRCTIKLKLKSFHVASGHFLCSIANSDTTKVVMHQIFVEDVWRIEKANNAMIQAREKQESSNDRSSSLFLNIVRLPTRSRINSNNSSNSSNELGGSITSSRNSAMSTMLRMSGVAAPTAPRGSSNSKGPALPPPLPLGPRPTDAAKNILQQPDDFKDTIAGSVIAFELAEKKRKFGSESSKFSSGTTDKKHSSDSSGLVGVVESTSKEKYEADSKQVDYEKVEDAGITLDDEKKEEEKQKEIESEKESLMEYRKYFLAISTHGIGGNTGWGNIGNHMETVVEDISSLIDLALKKLADQIMALKNEEEKATAKLNATSKLPSAISGDTIKTIDTSDKKGKAMIGAKSTSSISGKGLKRSRV